MHDRFYYRAYRNPLVFLLVGPLALVFYFNRFAFDQQQSTWRQRRNLYVTDLTLLGGVLAFGLWIGFGKLLLIALPVLYIAGGAGIWLFYIQHQFEHTYWKRGAEWNATRAAMQGSSFYKLPLLLRWFTGNIGFHRQAWGNRNPTRRGHFQSGGSGGVTADLLASPARVFVPQSRGTS